MRLLPLLVPLMLLTSSCAAPSGGEVRVVAVVRTDAGLAQVEEMVPEGAAEDRVERLRLREDVVVAGVAGARRAHSDPLLEDQWGAHRLDYGRVTVELPTASSVTVAVLDTGVDASHPDLAGRVLPGFDAISGSGPADSDPNGHGTHVAGIIAAVAGNGLGVEGFASGVSILPVRVLGADGYGDDADLAAGIVWAADAGASVVNMSIGGAEDMSLLRDAVDYAHSRGVLLVASAGNDALWGNAPSYPAAYSQVVAVAATTASDRRAMFSNTGPYVELAAPGSSIVSTWPGGRYIYSSGTSMAAPFVSAAAALVSAATGSSGEVLRGLLTGSALDVGAAGRDEEFGFGLVDALAASGREPVAAEPPSSLPLPGMPGLPDLPTFDLPPLPDLEELLGELPDLEELLPELPPLGDLPLPELGDRPLPDLPLLPELPPSRLPDAPSSSPGEPRLPGGDEGPQRRETSLSSSSYASGRLMVRLSGPGALVAFRSVSWSADSDLLVGSSGEVRLDVAGTAVLEVAPGTTAVTLEYVGSLTTLPSSYRVETDG